MQKSRTTEAYRHFLALLIAARKQAGLTQAELATGLGKPQSFVAKYENGERRLDLVETILIARLMRADLAAIVADVEARV